MTGAVLPGFRFEIVTVIKDTFALWRDNFIVVTALIIIFMMPAMAFAFAQNLNPQEAPWDLLRSVPVYIFLSTLLSLALIQVVSARAEGRALSVIEAIIATGPYILPGLGVAFLTFIGITIGLVFLVVPGLFLAVTWSVVLPVLVLEDRRGFASIPRSAELTRFCRGLILVLAVLSVAFSVVLLLLLLRELIEMVATRRQPEGEASVLLAIVITPIREMVCAAVNALGSVAIYRELKRVKDGGEARELADVFT